MSKWFALMILAVVLVITPAITHAQDGISLLDSSAQIFFPSALTFNVKAQSNSNIVKLRLHYQVDRMNYAPVTDEAWPVFTPSPKVQAQWVWNMRKASLPVGASINYWWTIEDASGDTLTTPTQTIRFDDIRYDWQKVTSGQITIFWYRGNKAFADQLMAACEQALYRLARDTGIHMEHPVSIYIYASQGDLLSAMVFPNEWTGGAAYAEFGIIAQSAPANDLEWVKRSLAHELGHLVTHQITFSPYGAILPTWLDEGLAMYAEGEQDLVLKSIFEKAASRDNLISVRSLASPFSAITGEALLSYGESQSIAWFLIQNYGGDKMFQLLNLFKEGNTYDDALMQVYGFDQDGLDAIWQKYITSLVPSQSQMNYIPSTETAKEDYLWNEIVSKFLIANVQLEVN